MSFFWWQPSASSGVVSDGLVLNLDAALGISIDTGVDNWESQVGGHAAIQGTAANQPLYNSSDADFNNLASVEFNDVQYMAIPDSDDFTSAVGYTFFFVIHLDNLNDDQAILRNRAVAALGSASGFAIELDNTPEYANFLIEDGSSEYRFMSSGGTPPILSTYILTVTMDNTEARVFEDGVQDGLADWDTQSGGSVGSVNSSTGIQIGQTPSQTRRLEARIGQILMYTRVLTTSEMNTNGRLLANKFALLWNDI